MEAGTTRAAMLTVGLARPVSSKVTLSRVKNWSSETPLNQSTSDWTFQRLADPSPRHTRLAELLPPMIRLTWLGVLVSNWKVRRLWVMAPAIERLLLPPVRVPL